MIPKSVVLRVARPTDNLEKITEMYVKGLGFKLLGAFEGHSDFYHWLCATIGWRRFGTNPTTCAQEVCCVVG